MDVASLLANERRARLAAERLLDMRQRELKAANRKLADHARALGQQVIAKRDEVETIQSQTETLRSEYVQTRAHLEKANSAAELAEGRLWSALQSVRDGFALFDADHRLIVANKAYLAVFDGLDCVAPGITYPEITRILMEEGIVDPQSPPGDWIDLMADRWTADQPPDVVVRLWNGQFVKLMDRRTPDGGTVTLGINQTDQLRMWAAVEAIPDGFVLYDQEDRMVMCNARYRELYAESAPAMVPGATFEEILRFGLTQGQFCDAVGREDQWLEERLADHRLSSRVLEQHLVDGRWLRILERVTPDGGRVGLRVDITAIKEQQAALEVERERAEAANRAKSAFLANMSHEIRTPMNGVVGMADLLTDSTLTEEQSLYVNTIKSSGEALLTILNDILDFSKIEAQKLELAHAPFDLKNCVDDVVCLLQPTVVGKPLRLSVSFAPEQPALVLGDGGRVRQVLTNLIGNALKFTEAGEVSVQVTASPEGVRIAVRDTGIGIPADKLDHIFGEFNQVEDDRNRRFDGTGLGLAICRQLVEQMGGTITVDSVLGQGSCFTATLPLATAPLDMSEPLGALARTPGLPHAKGRFRVLAAEDNKTNRLVLQKMLKDAGITLQTVENGADAVAAFKADPPDMVFMDISMPGMDGREATRQIRAFEAEQGLHHRVIVAMTAHAMASDKAEIKAAGIDHHLTKPLNRASLLAHIDAVRGL